MNEQSHSITRMMDDFYNAVKEAPAGDELATLMRHAGQFSDREAIEALARLCIGLYARVRHDTTRGSKDCDSW